MSDVISADPALFDVFETVWIPIGGDLKLAARIWMPLSAEKRPVPAVLEFLPYRRRDATSPRDESTYPIFASNGIAGVRVDMRGSGDSDGLFDDEYSEQELRDAETVIAWIASQSWCNGSVGMMGISWGGFNALQLAYRRPPALRAVISIASTTDRFADDIHYKGGSHLSAQLYWSTNMMAYMARPPDVAVVGDRWRDMWMERLEAYEPLLHTWLSHPMRDAYWQHGSICEDYSRIEAKCWVIAGWADAYRNTPWLAHKGMTGVGRGENIRATTGPWIHKYPHFAYPHPRLDFPAEAVRWWQDWLGDGEGETAAWPAHALYISSAVVPAETREKEPGAWMALAKPQDNQEATFRLYQDGVLQLDVHGDAAAPEGLVAVKTPQDLGVQGGEHFTVNCGPDLAKDQAPDDAKSVCFQTAPLEEDLIIAGVPTLSASLAIDQSYGPLIARIVDVHPDGTAHRVSLGVLNLSHRDSSQFPAPMTPNAFEPIKFAFDVTGYRFKKGHCIRLALSTTYFPLVLPAPWPVTAKIDLAKTWLRLPTPDLSPIELPEPTDPSPLPSFQQIDAGCDQRLVRRRQDGATEVYLQADSGLTVHPQNGMMWSDDRTALWSIQPDDPLSMIGEERVSFRRQRGELEVTGLAVGRIKASESHWHITCDLTVHENERIVFERSWSRDIPRYLM